MTILTDTIGEYTSAAGVTIDGLAIKDAGIRALLNLSSIGTNTLYVDPNGGGAYTNLSTALAAISDAAADNRYVIYARGDIAETATIQGKSHVDVFGPATITVTSTTSGCAVELDGVTDSLWRDLTIVRAGVIENNATPCYAAHVIGASDRTLIMENVVAQNLCTPAGTNNHFAGFVMAETAAPTLRRCQGIGSAAAIYGHGMWWRDSSSGRATDCVGRGGSNGGAANNWGMYIVANATPLLENCASYGADTGDSCFGLQIRGSAVPVIKNHFSLGGNGGANCHALIIDDAATPIIEGGVFVPGIGGSGSYSLLVSNYAAPQIIGASFVPRRFAGTQTITATTSFVASANVEHQIKSISWQVDVAGTGGATLAIGTTPGGGELVAATAITSTGTKYPVLIGAGAEVQLAAGATIYVTVTGTGFPSVLLFYGGEYAPSSCYGAYLGGEGAVKLDNCTIVGNCYSSYGLVIGTNARTANVLRITNCHIETRRKSSGSAASIYTSATYSNAPIHNCTIVGSVTNVTGAAGTANGTNVVL